MFVSISENVVLRLS